MENLVDGKRVCMALIDAQGIPLCDENENEILNEWSKQALQQGWTLLEVQTVLNAAHSYDPILNWEPGETILDVLMIHTQDPELKETRKYIDARTL